MQIIGFSKSLRDALAALDLQRESAPLTEQEHHTQETALIQAEFARLGLSAADGWNWGPTPPVKNKPAGYTSVFWKP